jgi:lysyl-tRNA synthetase class 2
VIAVRRSWLSAESLLAVAAGCVGAIGVLSALTPELANRVDPVRGVLPPGVPETARLVALALGLMLVGLSRSLRRRRRRAWQLAVLLVVGISLTHLVKGLDFEEAVCGLVLVCALVRCRKRFDVPGDPAATRPLLAGLSLIAGTGGVALALSLRDPLPERLESLLLVGGLLLGLWALWLWLRPISEHVRQTVEERMLVRELVHSHGKDSLAFFALRRDKSYFVSSARKAFLAYRVLGATALVSGDPVGEREEIAPLLSEFAGYARLHGWRLALLGVGGENLDMYRRLGLVAIKLGEEAVLRPEAFSLEGRSIRKVRQASRRLGRSGYRLAVVDAGAVPGHLRAGIEEVSAAWLGGRRERGFSMAIDDLFAADSVLAACCDRNGAVLGFLHLVPFASGRAYSLSTMRRSPAAPNGVMEFLIVGALEWAREQGVEELSLNFCAFRDLLAVGGGIRARRAARRLLLAGDRVFQLERLHLFSRKFSPDWRPRYLCVERLVDLPAVGLAALRAESLIAPPRLGLRWRQPVAA